MEVTTLYTNRQTRCIYVDQCLNVSKKGGIRIKYYCFRSNQVVHYWKLPSKQWKKQNEPRIIKFFFSWPWKTQKYLCMKDCTNNGIVIKKYRYGYEIRTQRDTNSKLRTDTLNKVYKNIINKWKKCCHIQNKTLW